MASIDMIKAMERDMKQRKRLMEEFEDRKERTEVLELMDREAISLDEAIAQFRFRKALDWIEGDVDRGMQLLADIANYDSVINAEDEQLVLGTSPEPVISTTPEPTEQLQAPSNSPEPVISTSPEPVSSTMEPSSPKQLEIVEEENEQPSQKRVKIEDDEVSSTVQQQMYITTIYMCENCRSFNEQIKAMIHSINQ